MSDNERAFGPSQECNERITQLLNEERNTLYGVQVLFAGMLAVPFTEVYSQLNDFQQHVHLAVLLSAALASVCLIAPGHYHRIAHEGNASDDTVRIGRRFATAGSALIVVAMTLAMGLVADIVAGPVEAILFSTIIASASIGMWFIVPTNRHAVGRSCPPPHVGRDVRDSALR